MEENICKFGFATGSAFSIYKEHLQLNKNTTQLKLGQWFGGVGSGRK